MLTKEVVLRESLIEGLKYNFYLSEELIKQDKSVQDIVNNIINRYQSLLLFTKVLEYKLKEAIVADYSI